jgi:hypothetical protein
MPTAGERNSLGQPRTACPHVTILEITLEVYDWRNVPGGIRKVGEKIERAVTLVML